MLLGRGDGGRVRDVLDELRLEGLEQAALATDRLARVGFDPGLNAERWGREVESAGEDVEFGQFEELEGSRGNVGFSG